MVHAPAKQSDAFQRDRGLPLSGALDAATATALFAKAAPSPPGPNPPITPVTLELTTVAKTTMSSPPPMLDQIRNGVTLHRRLRHRRGGLKSPSIDGKCRPDRLRSWVLAPKPSLSTDQRRRWRLRPAFSELRARFSPALGFALPVRSEQESNNRWQPPSRRRYNPYLSKDPLALLSCHSQPVVPRPPCRLKRVSRSLRSPMIRCMSQFAESLREPPLINPFVGSRAVNALGSVTSIPPAACFTLTKGPRRLRSTPIDGLSADR